MTTRRGLFGLIAGLAAAPVVAKLPPAAPSVDVAYRFGVATKAEALKDISHTIDLAEAPSHSHPDGAFASELREYIRRGLYKPDLSDLDV